MSTTVTSTQNANQKESSRRQTNCESKEHAYHATFSPRFDIWEGDSELVLYGDLPGVAPADLHINFEDRQLTIHGKVCRTCDGHKNLFSEYGIGDFQRTFAIGEAINSEGINAEMRDGVLTIHLPKSEKAKPRRIEVKVS